MHLIEKWRGGNKPIQTQVPGLREFKSPELTFYVPEGAIPSGGLTLEEQAIAIRHLSQLERLLSEIAKPTTQMLHTAANIRDRKDLGTQYDEEKKSGIKRTTTRLFGRWLVAQTDTLVLTSFRLLILPEVLHFVYESTLKFAYG